MVEIKKNFFSIYTNFVYLLFGRLLYEFDDAIDDGDGVFTYEFPLTFMPSGRMDRLFSLSGMVPVSGE
jgi:hypothetical protein